MSFLHMTVSGNGHLTCTHTSARFTVSAAATVTSYETYGYQSATDNHNFDEDGELNTGETSK